MNERVTVNGAVFFVGWRLTPYPTYRYVASLSAARPETLPDGGALRLIRATVPYIKRLLNTVGPRKRSAAGHHQCTTGQKYHQNHNKRLYSRFQPAIRYFVTSSIAFFYR